MQKKPIGIVLHEITVHYLEHKGFTTREFAKLIGLSQSNVMKLKKESNPNFLSHQIDVILDSLNLDYVELYEKYENFKIDKKINLK